MGLPAKRQPHFLSPTPPLIKRLVGKEGEADGLVVSHQPCRSKHRDLASPYPGTFPSPITTMGLGCKGQGSTAWGREMERDVPHPIPTVALLQTLAAPGDCYLPSFLRTGGRAEFGALETGENYLGLFILKVTKLLKTVLIG